MKKILLIIFTILIVPLNSKKSNAIPSSFADLAEKTDAVSGKYINHTNN